MLYSYYQTNRGDNMSIFNASFLEIFQFYAMIVARLVAACILGTVPYQISTPGGLELK